MKLWTLMLIVLMTIPATGFGQFSNAPVSELPNSARNFPFPDRPEEEHILAYVVAQDYEAIYFETTVNITPWLYDATCTLNLPDGSQRFVSVEENSMEAFLLDKSLGLRGYLRVVCTEDVFVDATISQYVRGGRKTGETNVFSVDDPDYEASIGVNIREDARIGFALANTTSVDRCYQLAIYSDSSIGESVIISVPRTSVVAFFLDEYDLNPVENIGVLHVRGVEESRLGTVEQDFEADFALMGLRYTRGEFFSAIPPRDSGLDWPRSEPWECQE